MNQSRIVINTLVAQRAHEEGTSQLAIIKHLLPLGYRNFELRREYFNGNFAELEELAALKLKYRLVYFYSISENLFVDGHLNIELLQFIAEARLMGANYLKMTLGNFDGHNINELQRLNRLLPDSMQLNLENDQSLANAKISRLVDFFRVANENNVQIGFVNDLGNWVYTKQDEQDATRQLLPYTRYVHLKGYETDNGINTTSFVDSQLDWQKLLKQFAAHLPVALEYPATIDELKNDLNVLNNFVI